MNYEGEVLCYGCESDYLPSNDEKSCIKVPNCKYLNFIDEDYVCGECKEGFALSSDKKSCIKFENCYQLKENITQCEKCAKHFYPNDKGQCERTLCSDYSPEKVCKECYEGYFLNDKKECEKIQIDNCLKLVATDNKKCEKCIAGIVPDNEGKCNLPENIIKGCFEYDKDANCVRCEYEYYDESSNGKSCVFEGCKGYPKYEYCGICKAGFELDESDGKCLGFDGSKDSSSSSSSSSSTPASSSSASSSSHNSSASSSSSIIKIKNALLIYILVLLI